MGKNIDVRSQIVSSIDPNEITDSMYGRITNFEWVRRKQAEFHKKGIDTVLKVRDVQGEVYKTAVTLHYAHEKDIPKKEKFKIPSYKIKKTVVATPENNTLYRCLRDLTEVGNGYRSPITTDELFRIDGKKE